MEEYNNWLKCPELQELTETEPCSLEEEFRYQKDWENDNQRTSNSALNIYRFIISLNYWNLEIIKLIRLKETGKLIGDVNLFFKDDDESIEINLMIAGKLEKYHM